MKPLLLFLLISATFWSCDRCRDIACTTPPPSVRFKLIYNGQNVSGNYPQARLYSLTGSSISDVLLNKTVLANNSVSLTGLLPFNPVTTFYLKLTDTDTDTLTLETRMVTENCCTSTQLTSIRFNGQETVNQVDADYCHLFVKR